MDLNDIKRGLRAEIKKRENEQYATFQCNVRQMCKDVLAKLEEQESEIAELKAKLKVQTSNAEEAWKLKDSYHTDYSEAVEELFKKNKQLRHNKYKRCLAQVENCRTSSVYFFHLCEREKDEGKAAEYRRVSDWFDKWEERWLELAERFKEEAK